MTFRNPITTAVDPVARQAAADAATPQTTLETATTGPRVRVRQLTPTAGTVEFLTADDLTNPVRMTASGTTGEGGRQSWSTALGRAAATGTVGQLTLSMTDTADVDTVPDLVAFGIVADAVYWRGRQLDLDSLTESATWRVGDIQGAAGAVLPWLSNVGGTWARVQFDWAVIRGWVVFTIRTTLATWAANKRLVDWPSTWHDDATGTDYDLRPGRNLAFIAVGGAEVILRASDGVMYLPNAGSTGVTVTGSYPLGG